MILGFLVFDLPHLAETALADYVLIPEQVFFYLRGVWHLKFAKLTGLIDFAGGGGSLLRILLLPLVCQMFGILQFKLGLFLRLHHIIIIELMVDLLEGDLREVHLRRLLDQLMDGALLAGNQLIVIGGFLALLEQDGLFGITIGFGLGSRLVQMVVNLFVNDGVGEAEFFGGFGRPRLL